MTFKISNERLQELLEIEESLNCDIGAGIDHGANLGSYLAGAMQYIDQDKLLALLRSELGERLPVEDLTEIVDQVQQQIHQRLSHRSA